MLATIRITNGLRDYRAPLDAKAAEFGKFMSTVWDVTTTGVDHLIAGMMSGEIMDGNHPLLLSVLSGGNWIDPERINKDLKIADLQE